MTLILNIIDYKLLGLFSKNIYLISKMYNNFEKSKSNDYKDIL